MAVADVFRCKMVGETREGEFSMNFHWQELTSASLAISTTALAEALSAALTPIIRAAIASTAIVNRWTADKLSGTKVPASSFSEASGSRVGTLGADALPANSPLKFNLGQALFSAKSNGRVWLSGIPTAQMLGSVIIPGYASGAVAAVSAALLADIAEVSAGDGLWRLVVLSRKFLLANPGDYAGAAADVLSVQADPRIAMMKSRTFGGKRKNPAPVPPPP